MEEKKLTRIERPCQGNFDKTQLALKQVENSIKHYFSKVLILADSEITRVVARPQEGSVDFTKGDVKRTYYLGLELGYRQEWKPNGYGLGDIITSITLLPNEELTFEVKTWETSKTQQDTSESLESKNISDVKAEKTGVSEILDDYMEKTHHQFDAHASAKWGWGKCSADYGYSNDVAEQHKTLSKSSQDLIQRSTNEITCKKTIKMTVSREFGSDEKTTRRIKNINQCRTLNAMFYQVLKEYEVTIYVDKINMLLFGPSAFKESWDYNIGMAERGMLDLEGNMVVQLKEQPLDWNGDYFQMNVSPHVIPRPDAVQINSVNQAEMVIYAYEIIPGFVGGYPKGMRDLLDFLYGYISTSSPPKHMKNIEIVKEVDIQGGTKRITPWTNTMFIPITHYLSDVALEEFPLKIRTINEKIIDDFLIAIKEVGKSQSSWRSTIPTHGIYAETLLGMCSGCEDYYEIQRQLELESKNLEIEKLKIEVERLKILNERSKQEPYGSNIVIKNPPQDSALRLGIGMRSAEDETVVSFEKEEK